MREFFWIFILMTGLVPAAFPQMNHTGRMEVELIDAQDGSPAKTPSENIPNHGNPNFDWRFHWYLDLAVSERTLIFVDLRLEPYRLDVDFAAIRLYLNSAKTWLLQAGVLGTPVGNVLPRRSSKYNPLIHLPLMYDYRTQLHDEHAISAIDFLDNRSTGAGLRVLNRGVYSPGVMLQVTFWEKMDWSAGFFNSPPSNPYMANENSRLNFSQRIGFRPFLGLNLGFSYSVGPYRPALESAPEKQILQTLYDLDFAFERGYWSLFGEMVFNQWDAPAKSNSFNVWGAYFEIKYKIRPGYFIAGRVATLVFQPFRFSAETEFRWDDNLSRYELGFGYYLARETLLKLLLQKNVSERVDLKDDYLALQLSAGL